MNRLLQLLSEKQTDWIKMAKSLPGKNNKSLSDDAAMELVQEMYVRMYKYVENPDKIMYSETELNTMYVYITLRNLYNSSFKYTKKFSSIDSPELKIEYEQIPSDEDGNLYSIAQMNLEDDILKEIESWHYYETKLFKLLHYEDIAMRKLSRETGISLSSIFNTSKAKKAVLRNKFKNEYNKIKKQEDEK
jgi:DNA-directed RNA polymerase specialized sigma24 family protein